MCSRHSVPHYSLSPQSANRGPAPVGKWYLCEYICNHFRAECMWEGKCLFNRCFKVLGVFLCSIRETNNAPQL